jgi:hypothetical protein
MTQEYPTIGYVKLADQLKLVDVSASASHVRGVWVERFAQEVRAAGVAPAGSRDHWWAAHGARTRPASVV